jgi:hypothetical protein
MATPSTLGDELPVFWAVANATGGDRVGKDSVCDHACAGMHAVTDVPNATLAAF